MASLAAYPGMMRRGRHRLGLRECRAAWLLGVTVREYRELEAGNQVPDCSTYERIVEVFGWPGAHVRWSTPAR
jgi:predicted transcriptional regulator